MVSLGRLPTKKVLINQNYCANMSWSLFLEFQEFFSGAQLDFSIWKLLFAELHFFPFLVSPFLEDQFQFIRAERELGENVNDFRKHGQTNNEALGDRKPVDFCFLWLT